MRYISPSYDPVIGATTGAIIKRRTAMRIQCKITSKLPFYPHRVVVNIIKLLLQESFVETGLGVKPFGKHPVALPLGSFSFAHRII